MAQSPSLYVGDLDPEINEAFLFDLFSQYAGVAFVRVCRDVNTKRSLGYAYVNFHSLPDAERAMEATNCSIVRGRPIRVMWSQRDPSLRKSGVGNVFIKNIDASVDNKTLFDTFSRFGNIMSVKIATDDTGASKGYAYIHFDSPEAATNAIEKANGMTLGGAGEPLVVAAFERKHDRSARAFTNVYVKNLDETVTQPELEAYFKTAGDVTSAFLSVDDTGKSRGFGFVNFTTPEAAQKAVADLNEKEWKGKKLYVGKAQTKKERESELKNAREGKRAERMRRFQGLNLYVKNLDDSMDDDKLRDAFAPFGTITSAKIMRDEKQASRGFGFVCFQSPEEAAKALSEMHSKVVGSKPIFVAMHQPKEQRKTYLEQLHQSRGQGMRPGMGPFPGGQPGVYPPPSMYYPPGPRPGPQGYAPYPVPMRGGWRGQQQGGAPQQGGQPRGQFPPQFGQGPRGAGRGGPRPQGGAPQQGGAGPQQRGNFQYKSGVRNATSGQPTDGGVQQTQQPSQTAPLTNELTPQALAQADPEQQKMILGERLYPLVNRIQPQWSSKITGMLLQMEISEILHLIESPDNLAESIREAMSVLQQAGYSDAQ
jgi:polyadenylate-binding protein